jgi:hypothetical protein
VLETAKAGENDHFGVTSELIKHARRIVDDLQRFQAQYAVLLPPRASARLQEFLVYYNNTFQRASGWTGIQGTLTTLASFRAEFQYVVANTEAVAEAWLNGPLFTFSGRSLSMPRYVNVGGWH